MSLDLTSFDPVLKSHYVDKRIWSLADLKSPFYSMVNKNTKAGGKKIVQVVDFENPNNGSAAIADAIANSGPSQYEDFLLDRTKNYQVAVIDNETIWASKDDRNAFKPALKEVDKAFKQAGRRDAKQIFRSRGGALGQLATTTNTSSAIAILTDRADAFNFQVGQICQFATTDGTSGALLDSGDVLTVTAVNRAAGTVTFGANLTDIASITTSSYIFAKGDFGACMAGLDDWLPTDTSGLGTAFYGVTRSLDADRLGGLRLDASGMALDEALQDSAAEVEMHGGSPDYAFMNPKTLSDLLILTGSKSRYDKVKVKGRAPIGFSGADIQCGTNTVTCMGDVNCQTGVIWMLQMDTWTLHSAGPSPMFLDRDGLLQRGATTDDYQVRVGGYRNLGCSAPGYNIRINL